ncbi:MFS transporter [Rhizorhabdus dicambivorans]|uniref:MFS transporter n=1 Tax=Rhizorhabdus dicambivorans TaxID=1850238 RepID=A0A2A4FW63_9SPHN|nr:MFS transporter [Rhizorhabdus dicambivorans]ATE64537.1 MFS transporter [Rhizorhabdus dicambivorans]PCE41631.1 MFS transporter [Rhizorhabdus dicambivorans]
MHRAPHPGHSRETGFARSIPALVALSLAIAAGNQALNLFSIVQEAAKAELALSDTQLGFIQGVGAALPLVLLSLPIGRMIDHRNRIRVMIGLALSAVAGLLVIAFANGATALFIGRMFTSLAANCAVAACISIAADLCVPARRGSAMLILTLGKWGGTAGSFALGGWLFGLLGEMPLPAWTGLTEPWRGAHLVVAAITVIAILPLFFLREPPRRETIAGEGAPLRVVLREIVARRGFILPMFAGQIAVAMVDIAAGIWAAPVLSRNYGLQPQQFAQWMGLVVFAAGIAGSLSGGIAADFGHRTGRRGGILLGAVGATILSVPLALFPLAPDEPSFAIMLGLFLFCGTAAGLIVSTAIAVLLPNELRGLCIGLFIAMAGIIGFGLAPVLITVVSGLLGGEAQLGTALAIVGVATTALASIAFPLAMRHAPQDSTSKPF